MIVKNEAHVIERALESALPLVDFIYVEDTGSADDTPGIVLDFMAKHGIGGAVTHEPWQNFAFNRTHALNRLREGRGADYALRLDADDILTFDDGFSAKAFKSQLDKDIYDVRIAYDTLAYSRPDLVSVNCHAVYKGVTHEYLEVSPDATRGTAEGFAIKIIGGGARHAGGRKFETDAELLEKALETETDPFMLSRYRFYLAQSYRDAGLPSKALANYLLRASLDGWVEERYVATYEAANLMWKLGFPAAQVLGMYGRAIDLIPTRAEALFAATMYSEGRRSPLTQPSAGLFLQPHTYRGKNDNSPVS